MTEFLNYLPVVMIGYYMAWDSVFEKLAAKLSQLRISIIVKCSIYLFLFFCFIVIRGMLTGSNWFNIDVMLASIFIFCTWFLIISLEEYKATALLKKGLCFLGKYSLEIWFLHAVFFIGNATVQKIAYWPRIDIFILIWTIALLIPFAMVIHKAQNTITAKLFNSIGG